MNLSNKYIKTISKILRGEQNIKFCTVIGARPNFTKMSPIIDVINKRGHQNIVIHTGQHYDKTMSDLFLDELNIHCHKNLNIGSGTHGYQTGLMLLEIEKILIENEVDVLLVPGDTNSGLAGALAAVKMHIPVAHVEAGLRSFDRKMPEEINRILIDHCSNFLFCPTETGVKNLLNEGVDKKKIFLVGDTMVEACTYFADLAQKKSTIFEDYDIKQEYFLATIHRAENTDDKCKLTNIITSFLTTDSQIVFPLHPRTKIKLEKFGLLDTVSDSENILITEPVGYIDFLKLLKNAKLVLTDSGGVQKEAFLLKTPCITLRENTEWVETLYSGWNVLVGTDKKKILEAISSMQKFDPDIYESPFGDGTASEKIVDILENSFQR